MRRVLLSILSAVVLLGFSVRARAADDVKDILTKAAKAHNSEKLEKYKAAKSKSKGKMNLAGVGEVEFTQEVAAMEPNKVKDVLELKVGEQTIIRTLWYNGDKMVVEANGKEVKLSDDMLKDIKERFKDAEHMGKVAKLLPLLKGKGYEMSLVGEEKVEGKPAVGVLVKAKGQKDITLYFNKETGLLAKVQHRTKVEGTDKEVTEDRIIVEYEKADGVPLAKKLLIKHDGEKYIEAEVVERKMLEKLDDSEFTK
jgi:hypothetical protein